MKSIYDIINEENNSQESYVVYDVDGEIMGIYPDDKTAKSEAERLKKETGGAEFTVKKEKNSEFIEE